MNSENIISYKSTTIACYIGNFIQATVINIAPILFIPLKDEFGLSYTQLGALILINFITQVIVDIACSKPVDRYGFRPFIGVAHILCVLGFILFAVTPNIFKNNVYLGFIISTMIFAGAGGLLELLLSPIVDSIPTDEKATSMSLLHSFYAWGQVTVILVTTIFLYIFGKNNWNIIVMIWAIIPFVNFFIFAKVPLTQKVHETRTMKIRQLIKNPIFIIAFFGIMFGAASEVTMNQWASTFMEKGLMLPKVLGDTAGMCMFAIMLGVGRAIYGVYGSRINVNKIMIIGSFCAMICYVVVAISPSIILSIIACAICGIFVSLLWPGTLVIASEELPLAGASLFALLAAGGDIGASVGPWFMGKITDITTNSLGNINATKINIEQMSLRLGILFAAIFPLIAVILFIMLNRKKNNPETNIFNKAIKETNLYKNKLES